MSLGQRIQARRQELKLTQMELGNAAGIHQRQISKYENDRNEPSPASLRAIAETLDVSTDWLLGMTDIKRRPPETVRPIPATHETETHLLSEIGIRLRQSRNAVRLSIEDVAASIDSTEEDIEAYEYGSKPICVDKLLALADLYNEKPEYLLFGLTSLSLSLRQELAEIFKELQNVPAIILMQYIDTLRAEVKAIKTLAEREQQRISEMDNLRRSLQQLWREATDPERKKSLKVLLDDLGGPSADLDLQDS